MGIEAVLRNFDMHRAITSIAQITVLQAEGAVEYSLAGQPYEHCIHAGLDNGHTLRMPLSQDIPGVYTIQCIHTCFIMGIPRQP